MKDLDQLQSHFYSIQSSFVPQINAKGFFLMPQLESFSCIIFLRCNN